MKKGDLLKELNDISPEKLTRILNRLEKESFIKNERGNIQIVK